MPICTINNMRVFISSERSLFLHNECIKNAILPEGAPSFMFAGSDEVRKRDEFIYDYLMDMAKNDLKNFIENWVKFDIIKKEIISNIWYLLNDYCYLTGYYYLSRASTGSNPITEMLSGDFDDLPLGKVFSLNYVVPPQKWYWKFTHGMTGRKIKVIIDIDKVNRIFGELNNFEIEFTNNSKVLCTKDNVIFSP